MFCNLKKSIVRGLLSCAVVGGVFVLGTEQRASAQIVRIEFENLGGPTDVFLAPLWVGLHNGDFDLFDVDELVTPGLELLAEAGPPSLLVTEFEASGRLQGVVTNPADFGSMPGQPPVFDPGNSSSTNITIINPVNYRYFSFASMIIPSNDAFIGNDNPTEWELFDADGNFNGPLTINITAADIYDAGTELNDGLGAEFSTNGGTATDTTDGVTQGPDLSNFIDTDTAAGTTIGAVPVGSTPFARITITVVPEPTSVALLGMGLVGLCGMRRRRR